MLRRLLNLLTTLSLLLCVAVAVLWVRGRAGLDAVSWRYDRWLPDGSAASTQVHLTSDRRLWLSVSSGRVGPPNGQLVWGYYINADQSGGRPRLTYRHEQYDGALRLFSPLDDGTSGIGPARWEGWSGSLSRDGHDHRGLRVGVSHWLAALLVLAPPMLWLPGFRKARHMRLRGLCSRCGYDLRATPGRCPECGHTPAANT